MEECDYIKNYNKRNFYKVCLYPNMKMKYKIIIFALSPHDSYFYTDLNTGKTINEDQIKAKYR